MLRVVVTGSHHLALEVVWEPLWWLIYTHGAMQLVHSDHPGADAHAHAWATLSCQPWNTQPDPELLVVEEVVTGENVNEQMLAGGETGTDLVVAFPDERCRDSLDCIARAFQHDIPVMVFTGHGRYHMLSSREGDLLVRNVLGGYGS